MESGEGWMDLPVKGDETETRKRNEQKMGENKNKFLVREEVG